MSGGEGPVWLLVRWGPAHVTGSTDREGWVCDLCSEPMGTVDLVTLGGTTAVCDGCLDEWHGGAEAVRAAAVPCGCSGCEWARRAL